MLKVRGTVLLIKMLEKGIDVKDLAEVASVSQKTVYNYLKSHRGSIRKISNIAQALGCDVEEIIDVAYLIKRLSGKEVKA